MLHFNYRYYFCRRIVFNYYLKKLFFRCLTFGLIVALLSPAIAEDEVPYQVYRYISPEGRLVFSAEKKSGAYIRLYKIPEGWVPQNELSLYDSTPHIQAKPSYPREEYDLYIRAAADRYRLPYYLLHAVITIESSYRREVVSHAGAQGLMQLMPETAARFGVSDPFDAQQNIDGGSRYLRYLLRLFNGNLELALAAYNAGENAVVEHGNRIPPYPETQNYVENVLATYRKYRFSDPPS